jgi:hypothetical protein
MCPSCAQRGCNPTVCETWADVHPTSTLVRSTVQYKFSRLIVHSEKSSRHNTFHLEEQYPSLQIKVLFNCSSECCDTNGKIDRHRSFASSNRLSFNRLSTTPAAPTSRLLNSSPMCPSSTTVLLDGIGGRFDLN